MKAILSERNLVVLLFVMVMITFSLAHEDTKKMEYLQNGASTAVAVSAQAVKPGVPPASAETMIVIPQVR